jgi:hypothetical protein
MNRLGIVLLVLGIVGCSSGPEKIDTSGNHPALGSAAPMTPEAKEAEVDTGRLLVATPGAGYTVYTPDGYAVAHEFNRGNVEHKLAPGRYFVRMDHPGPDRDFWVTIEKARVTRVDPQPGAIAPPVVK